MAITRFTPIRLSPWRELGDFSTSFGRLFNEAAERGSWTPAVSVEESADELLFSIEVPGVARDAISVEVKNDVLTVRGEKKEEREEKDEGLKYHVWERHFGSFQRTFKLPSTVSVDDVGADYQDGVLSIRVPKLPEAKARQIEVTAAE